MGVPTAWVAFSGGNNFDDHINVEDAALNPLDYVENRLCRRVRQAKPASKASHMNPRSSSRHPGKVQTPGD